MTVITRFAPSPTGMLHIGSARTALFNYLFAKKMGGKFLLRIEDTDKKRSSEEAIAAITNGLAWLELTPDEPPIFQSSRVARHQEVAKELVKQNAAYYDEGAIRIKAPKSEGAIIINDLVQGEISVANQELDDMVLLRSDGGPTYMLAVVVDDFDMGITHVIRGADHLTNAFRQRMIYDAMGWKVPEFAHIPLINDSNGLKLSKRRGAAGVAEYKKMGYLPQALRNYLLRLGWSHGDDEIINDKQATMWFSLEHVGRSPARFDFKKLDNLNHHYIQSLENRDAFDLCREFFANSYDHDDEFALRAVRAISFLKERSSRIVDLATALEVYRSDFLLNKTDEFSQKFAEALNRQPDLTIDIIKSCLAQLLEQENLKLGAVGKSLRESLTGEATSQGSIAEIVLALGKAESVRRAAGLL